MEDSSAVGSVGSAAICRKSADQSVISVTGEYNITCTDAAGNLKWSETFDNLVVDTGKKFILDSINTTLTAVGPYLGLISGASPTVAAADTMASKGWTEIGTAIIGATSGGQRGTPTWTSATGTGTVSKTHSGSVSFTAAGSGTIGGCFIVLGTGAVTTVASTAGTLYSAGAFTAGAKTVTANDVLQVTYTTTLS